MDYALQVTDKELDELKSQIDAQKKIREYEQLKKNFLTLLTKPIIP